MSALTFLAGASAGATAAGLYCCLRSQKCEEARQDRRIAVFDSDIVSRPPAETASARLQPPIDNSIDVLPDLLQVHVAISAMADSISSLSDLDYLTQCQSTEPRKWMFTLVPVWNWRTAADKPQAEEFWKLAHAVARDQNRDDWIAPHVTLHSRSNDLNGVANVFVRLLNELGQESWTELLSTLREESNWVFDEDGGRDKPTIADHYVLHKTKITLPRSLRAWLEDNQSPSILMPRKQDQKRGAAGNGKYVVEEPFHISLYSFRAARPAATSEDMDPSLDNPSPKHIDAKPLGRLTSYAKQEPRFAHHEIISEDCLRDDLAKADWTLVLISPGWTGTPAVVPKVMAAVRLSDVASGALFK